MSNGEQSAQGCGDERYVPAGNLARVRYRAGVVGERRRVVHLAMVLSSGDYLGLCELRLPAVEAEEISDLLGMPCMVCTRVLAVRSWEPESVAVREESPTRPVVGGVLAREPE